MLSLRCPVSRAPAPVAASSRRRRVAAPAAAAVLALLVAACGSTGTGGKVEYSVSAMQNYERGMKRLKDERWADAIKYFSFVKTRFPYSKYAALADLRVADAQHGAEAYIEAVDGYRNFMRLHPTHEMVKNGYAAFQIGASYYKMIPDDWAVAPPVHEKDLTAPADAGRELASFLKRYPDSRYAPKGRKMYRRCARILAAHEWYVANYYWDRDRPMGAVLRLRTLLRQYPGVGYDERALYLLGRAYVKVGRRDDARKSFQTLVVKHPKHELADDAREALGRLGG